MQDKQAIRLQELAGLQELLNAPKLTGKIEYDGYEMDTFKVGSKTYYGHPRKKDTNANYTDKRLVYKEDELENLKDVIHQLKKGTDVEDIDLPPNEYIKNPEFRG
jgi:hypothetical protein